MRSTLFRIIGGSLLTIAIVWALVLAWWQSNDYQPDRLELVLYLGALPLALVGGYWLLRGFIEHLKAAPDENTVAPPLPVDDDPLAGARARTAAAERSMTLHLVDAFVSTPAGASGDDILAALDAGKRPDPSEQLTDGDGFPVFVATVADVDVESMAERLAELPPDRARFAEPEDAIRILALLDGVLEKACAGIASLVEASAVKLHLHVLWMITGTWDSGQFPDLRAWLQSTYWPTVDKGSVEITLVHAASEVDAMKLVDEAILRANRNPLADEVLLLVSAVSSVTQQRVEAWEAAGSLFSARHPDRQIPGEGAAAILLMTEATATQLAITESVVISRVGHGMRDKPVHAGGRIGGRLIEQLVAGVLDVSGLAAAKVIAAISDVDHRANHLTEMLEGLGAPFEHLDPVKDCLATGSANGALAPVGSLVVLACARSRVLAAGAPVLCLSNQHERERAVLLAMPGIAPATPEPLST
jgi:hypothetical protein